MFVTTEFISGVCFGVQFITKEELEVEENGWYLILEIGIIRLIFEK